MLCHPDPCECYAPKKSAPRKRPVAEGKAAPLEPASEALPSASGPPRQDLRAKMKAAAAQAPAIQIKPLERKQQRHQQTELTHAVPAPRPLMSDEQLLHNAALRALGPIMHSTEHERYRMLIDSTPSESERKAEWKARRRCLQESQ